MNPPGRDGAASSETTGPQASRSGASGSGAVMRKRSLQIAGHRTSVSLEDVFWSALREIAATRGLSIAALVAEIDQARGQANLSSAIRVFVVEVLRAGQTSPQARPQAEA